MAGMEEDLNPELAELMDPEEAERAASAARAQSAGPFDDRPPRLRQLADLRDRGMLSNAEYEAARERIFRERVSR